MTLSRRIFAALLAAVLAASSLPAGTAAQDGQQESGPEDAGPQGVLALPDVPEAPAVLLLPDADTSAASTRERLAELAERGFLAFAPGDGTAGEGTAGDLTIRDLAATVEWLREHPDGNGTAGIIGWGSGGARVLDVALAAPVSASVIFSAPVERPSEALRALQGPLMVHLGRADPGVAMDPTNVFIGEMRKAGKAVEVYWYRAGADFTDPQAATFDEADARLAWERTLDFLDARLRD